MSRYIFFRSIPPANIIPFNLVPLPVTSVSFFSSPATTLFIESARRVWMTINTVSLTCHSARVSQRSCCLNVFCIVLYCIALHCIALHCIALHCIALHCIALHCIALHCIALHCIALHCIALHCIVLYDASCFRDKDKTERIVKSLNLTVRPRDLRSTDCKVRLQAICNEWLPLADSLLGK